MGQLTRKMLAPFYIYEISKNIVIGIYPNFKVRKLIISVTSSNFPLGKNMSSIPSIQCLKLFMKDYHLMYFVLNHLLPKCPWQPWLQSVPTIPMWQGGECCKMPPKGPILQLARIQRYLVVVDTFKDNLFTLLPFSFVLL